MYSTYIYGRNVSFYGNLRRCAADKKKQKIAMAELLSSPVAPRRTVWQTINHGAMPTGAASWLIPGCWSAALLCQSIMDCQTLRLRPGIQHIEGRGNNICRFF